MQQFSINGSEQVSRNHAEETLAPAEQSAPALVFKTLPAKDRAPGLVVRTQLKAGVRLRRVVS
jgi:hypothetical protein